MAPTTLVGQRTMTTPGGRSPSEDGGPIGMAELIASLRAPVYVERVSLGDTRRLLAARKAVRKALKNQIEGRGFSFVEILSPCPINWKMQPVDARRWLIENLEPVFPLGVYRDAGADSGAESAEETAGESFRGAPGVDPVPSEPIDDKALIGLLQSRTELEPTVHTPVAEQRVKVAGFGGQGVLSAGVLLANCAIAAGQHATWLPSYGPEMRGGTANASVIISDEEIGSPLVDRPTTLLAMNGPSLEAFESTVEPGGLIVANSSLISATATRDDVRFVAIPATDMATELGFAGAANVIMLTVHALATGFPTLDVMRTIIPHTIKRKNLVDTNLRMIEAAERFVASHPVGRKKAASKRHG